MDKNEAFQYLRGHEIGSGEYGPNFKVTYCYKRAERAKFKYAFSIAYNEHGSDVVRGKLHYKFIAGKDEFIDPKSNSLIEGVFNLVFGPYYAEVVLSRENEIIINTNNVNISDVEQIIINTETIVSIKAKKSEVINNYYEFEQSDFIRLLNIIENIENNLLENRKQDINDLDFLEEIKDKVPKLRALIADIITIVSVFS